MCGTYGQFPDAHAHLSTMDFNYTLHCARHLDSKRRRLLLASRLRSRKSQTNPLLLCIPSYILLYHVGPRVHHEEKKNNGVFVKHEVTMQSVSAINDMNVHE